MKKMLKRTLGLFLSILMIVSVCTVGLTSIVSAAEVTHNDLGATDGTDMNVYDDPTGTGDKVFRLYCNNNRPNFELADPTDNTKKWEPVVGKVYTIKFDYYLDDTSSANGMDITLYYGAQSAHSSKYSKESMGSASTTYGYTSKYIGDNQWHTMSISFKAVKKTGKVAGVADQVLPYMYLTYYSAGKISGYIKNIEIITESTTENVYTEKVTYDLGIYFNEDKTANTSYFNGTNASAMTNSYVNDAGEKVFVPINDNVNVVSDQTVVTSDYISLYNKDRKTVNSTHGYNYVYRVKYKVLKLSDTDNAHAGIGIGRRSTTAGKYVLYDTIKVTEVSNDWQYFIADFDGNTSGMPMGLYVAGTGAEIAIDSVEVIHKGPGAKKIFANYTFNNNGVPEIHTQYPNTDLTTDFGVNEENAAMGEYFMGWYVVPDFAAGTAITKVPAAGCTLYARYPSTIIDYDFRTNFASGSYGSTIATSSSNAAGTMTAKYSQYSGMMLPSYDANIAPNTKIDDTANGDSYGKRYAAFYQFKEGKKYRFTFVYSTESAGRNLRFLYANGFQTGNSRDTSGETTAISSTVASTNGEYVTATFDFTHDPKESSNKIYTYHSGKNDDITALAMRTSSASAFTITFDKIIITEISDDTYPYLDPVVTLDYNDGVTASETVKVKKGTQYALPTPAEREGYMFIGWYRSGNTIDSVDTKNNITTDNIVLPGYYVATEYEAVTLVAKYISTESVTVDFSESIYGTLTNRTDLGGSAGQFTIANDETIDTEGGSTDNTYLKMDTVSLGEGTNIYKTSLYKDDGSRYLVYEGVSYKFDIRYKVVSPITGNRTDGYIAICRNAIGRYKPDSLDNPSSSSTPIVKATETTDTFVTASATIYNKYMYQAAPGTGSANYDYEYNNQLSIMISDGIIYVDYITVTPVSYTPSYIDYDQTKGTVNVDYVNKTFEVVPNEGYEVSAKGASVLMNYKDFTYNSSADKLTVVTNTKEALALNNTADGKTFTWNGDYSVDRLGALSISVEFVEATANNASVIGVSTRKNGEVVNGEEKKAGIRFRGRVSTSTVENADEVGFVVIPTKALNGKTIEKYIAANPESKVPTKGVVYSSERHIIYSQMDGYNDYQIVLTLPENLYELELSIAMYVKTGDKIEYMQVGATAKYSDYVK